MMVMVMMVVMVVAAVVMAKCSKCYSRDIHGGSKNMDVKCLILPGLSQGKLWLDQFGSLGSKCQERIRHMRDYRGEVYEG